MLSEAKNEGEKVIPGDRVEVLGRGRGLARGAPSMSPERRQRVWTQGRRAGGQEEAAEGTQERGNPGQLPGWTGTDGGHAGHRRMCIYKLLHGRPCDFSLEVLG